MSTTTAKRPRPLRLNQKAALVPEAQFQSWYDQAIQVPSLTKDELAVLSAVVEYYRLLDQRGYARPPTIEMMAQSAQVRSIDITSAINHLTELGLVAVKPGAGARRNEYLLALPRRVAKSMLATAADDAAPPF
jgi:hypothetical protein